ncbi:hypothetical protein ANOM_007205 [Aspergillus nomiae NRRL 13137]|uniref:Nudix hydrolase domain-containing protein n=1 Tax=Aspergillus nomiae NRRL (strain ATCC 15546 / NRRL 13137 / CBS 260.88 / M93) TaxID=1509407 RepID=A0A0L1IW58_ASPN3|nr:uncharacterized protein ANOM_007205 [Aspergillus nomiae NRRL 13137]KNG83635.1 hypothetical protein ANOM_007205 [Aspergillus nomiae NRRL 13137]
MSARLYMIANGDCITHVKPKCESGILLNGDCVVGNPTCPDNTDHRDQNCVSRELPKCTEEGYEWSELEKQCRSKEKTECPDRYRAENGQCVSGDLPDCGEHGTLQGKDCFSKQEPKCSDDTYWDGEDCRSPDEPDCGEGKCFKKEKNTCVAVEEPVCDDPDTVFDKVLNNEFPFQPTLPYANPKRYPPLMAASPNTTTQYTSDQFVESCGAILFDLSTPNKTVCLIHYRAKNEWLLAKGRRNCGETRHEAALREVREETGYQAHLHPVTMHTRAPPRDEQEHVPDIPRLYPALTEPFMVTIRQLDGDGVKIIWWYVAALDGGVGAGSPGGWGEEEFTPAFFSLGEAVERLSFEDDRAVLRKAIALVEAR